MSARASLPIVALALAAGCVLVQLEPALAERLVLARGEVLHEPWRLLTGHLVHELPRVLLLDAGALVLLAALVERRSRGLSLAVLAGAGLGSSLAFVAAGEAARLVGSSGLSCGLFAALGVLAARDGRRGTAALLLSLLGLKLGLELAGLAPTALGSLPAGYGVAPAAHVGGALGGGLAAGLAAAWGGPRRAPAAAPS